MDIGNVLSLLVSDGPEMLSGAGNLAFGLAAIWGAAQAGKLNKTQVRKLAANRVGAAFRSAARALILADEDRAEAALKAFVVQLQRNVGSDLKTLGLELFTTQANQEITDRLLREVADVADDIDVAKPILKILEKFRG